MSAPNIEQELNRIERESAAARADRNAGAADARERFRTESRDLLNRTAATLTRAAQIAEGRRVAAEPVAAVWNEDDEQVGPPASVPPAGHAPDPEPEADTWLR